MIVWMENRDGAYARCVCVCGDEKRCVWGGEKPACQQSAEFLTEFSEPSTIRQEDVFISVRKLQFWPLTPFPARTTVLVTFSSPLILHFWVHRLAMWWSSTEINATDQRRVSVLSPCVCSTTRSSSLCCFGLIQPWISWSM